MHRPTLLLTCPLLFLTLSLGEARATAVFTAPLNAARAPDAAQTPTTGRNEPLERTYWRATELVGKPAPPPPPEPTRETHLQFDAGRVSGSDGCNLLTGSYHLNGDRITFSQMAGTQMACINTGGTEDLFRDVLKRASRLTVTAAESPSVRISPSRTGRLARNTSKPPTRPTNGPASTSFPWRSSCARCPAC